MVESALCLTISEKLHSRHLPLDIMRRIWGGPAGGQICGACDAARFHVPCFYLWDDARHSVLVDSWQPV